MAKARADLVAEALANLGINIATVASTTNTRAQVVTEALKCLGVVNATFATGTKTKVDLINNVLAILGPLAAGQTADAGDVAEVTKHIDPVAADLASRRIVTISDTNSISNTYFEAFSVLVANAARYIFGVTGEAEVGLINAAKLAEADLKIISRSALVDEKFDAVGAELSARAIVNLPPPVVTVPAEWVPAVAAILANSCKAAFAMPEDVAARLMAEATKAEQTLKNITQSFLVDRNLDPILSLLAAQNIVYLADVTQIPDEWFIPLAAIVADRCKGKFELDPLTIQRVTADGINAVADLREITRGRPSYLPQQTVFF